MMGNICPGKNALHEPNKPDFAATEAGDYLVIPAKEFPIWHPHDPTDTVHESQLCDGQELPFVNLLKESHKRGRLGYGTSSPRLVPAQ